MFWGKKFLYTAITSLSRKKRKLLGIFFDLPQNRGADRQQNVFDCIAANFYPFLTLVPYFFQECFELFKNEKNSQILMV